MYRDTIWYETHFENRQIKGIKKSRNSLIRRLLICMETEDISSTFYESEQLRIIEIQKWL